jgi:myo-inositol-1(or 4)-monophosphatase
MYDALRAMFEAVRDYLLAQGHGARQVVATNPKGEATRGFDAEAERLALDVALHHLGPLRIFSEEMGEAVPGEGDPRWTLVLDPCDGSNNFRRGVRAVGFAAAILPPTGPLGVDRVLYAAVGDVFSDTFYFAGRGSGALRDGEPCHASAVTGLRRAMIGINIGRTGITPAGGDDEADGPALPSRIWSLLSGASTARRMGASVLDLAYVADGAYEAYVDLRARLTPENFLAPSLLITEAGGWFGDAAGHPITEVEFTKPYSVVAAANTDLLAHILDALRG